MVNCSPGILALDECVLCSSSHTSQGETQNLEIEASYNNLARFLIWPVPPEGMSSFYQACRAARMRPVHSKLYLVAVIRLPRSCHGRTVDMSMVRVEATARKADE